MTGKSTVVETTDVNGGTVGEVPGRVTEVTTTTGDDTGTPDWSTTTLPAALVTGRLTVVASMVVTGAGVGTAVRPMLLGAFGKAVLTPPDTDGKAPRAELSWDVTEATTELATL